MPEQSHFLSAYKILHFVHNERVEPGIDRRAQDLVSVTKPPQRRGATFLLHDRLDWPSSDCAPGAVAQLAVEAAWGELGIGMAKTKMHQGGRTAAAISFILPPILVALPGTAFRKGKTKEIVVCEGMRVMCRSPTRFITQ